ncbi:MAG: hypothetical protein A3K19_01985 [Lentisphaerae bacterium RIFOXYB12_FULL_65_16]|nr:MAG: hypothetical protein A3K18_29410 [Lentisphaerae bacterium RIFOXYA12_64_32]OGV92648.1 MAG: hypothetical protein A3K19_01985 [Lentisphaerae bacterium RIFOXYB12_FULL_65_16]
MKAIVVSAPHEWQLADVPQPVIRDYECLVKTKACGLCSSTDLKVIAGKIGGGPERYPFVLGHEGAGEVVEVGRQVRNYKVGDIVTDPTQRFDNGCKVRPNCGQFAEYAIVQDLAVMAELGITEKAFRANCSRRVPPGLAFEDAAMLLTFKETLSALRNFGFQPGMDVLVYGDGPVGLALVKLARLAGAGWLGAVGHWDERLARIATFGGADATVNAKTCDPVAALKNRKLDIVIDAVGSSAIIKQALGMLKSRGKVCVFGVLAKDDPGVNVRDLPNNTGLHLLQWPVGEHEVHDEVLEMVRSGRLDPKNWYSHVMPVAEFGAAVEKVRTREAFKVVVTF